MALNYSHKGFEGLIESLDKEINPIIEIQCNRRSCKLSDADLMYQNACEYIDSLLESRKVKTYTVLPNISIEHDTDGTKYIDRVSLQIILS